MESRQPDAEPAKASPRAHGDSPPEEFTNPAGVGGDVCDVDETNPAEEPCDPTEAKDMVLEESKPGYGIAGYEGEEVGGG